MSINKTVVPSRILVPEGIDLTKWACIACDQHTSEIEYWEQLKEFVGADKSALKVIFPEAYLDKIDRNEKIAEINKTMQEYLSGGLFKEYYGYILTVRTTLSNILRVGIVAAIDLDAYSYKDEDKSLIRATEGTVLKRIPPRVQIRENAPIELTHVMLLANDTDYSVIEKLYRERENFEKVYDFDLNMKGGHVEGYFIPDSVDLQEMFSKSQKGDMLFAVGDGNHSLATAKTVYENEKKEGKATENSLSRYALCEIVNLNSDGITFEPIHRLVKNVDVKDFCNGMKYMFGGNGIVNVITKDFDNIFDAPENTAECYDMVQAYIDNYIENNGGEVDYIHGFDVLKNLAENDGCVGIVMPTLKKSELFPLVDEFGSLPRKTFSMGEADDKRYYLEARRIK